MQTALKITVAFNCAAICILLYAFSKDSERIQTNSLSPATGTANSLPTASPGQSHQTIFPISEIQPLAPGLSRKMPPDDQAMMQQLHIGTPPDELSN